MKNSITGLSLLTALCLLVLLSCKNSKKAANENEKSINEMSASDKDSIAFVRIDNQFTPPAENDPFNIISVSVKGDIMEIEISYSGGCSEHQFGLVFNGVYKKSLPAKADLYLLHDSKDDHCRSIVEKKLAFNIQPLRFPAGKAGELHLFLNGWNEMIRYVYP